jgi:hypothetical protein
VSAFAASTKRDLTYLTVPLPGVLMRERVFARSAGAVHV